MKERDYLEAEAELYDRLRKEKGIEPPKKTIGEKIVGGVEKGLEYAGQAAEYVDKLSGGPVRSAIMAGIEGKPIAEAYLRQMGTAGAPSGIDIARKIGVPDVELPIPNVSDEDILFNKGAIPSAETANINPVEVAGMAIEQVDPLTLATGAYRGVGAFAKAIPAVKMAIEDFSAMKAAKAIAPLAKGAGAESLAEEAGMLGHVLMNEGLGDYLNDPQKLLHAIEGKPTVKHVPTQGVGGKQVLRQVVRKGGKIEEISTNTKGLVDQVSLQAPPVRPLDIRNYLLNERVKLMQTGTSAIPSDPTELKRYNRLVNQYTINKGNTPRTIADIQKLKQEIDKTLSSKDFSGPIQDANLQIKKQALKDLRNAFSDIVYKSAESIDPNIAGQIKINNNKVHAFMDLSEALSSVPIMAQRSESAMQKGAKAAVSGATGVGMYSYTGNPFYAVLAAGGTGKVLGLGEKASMVIPRMQAKGAWDFLHGVGPVGGGVGRAVMGADVAGNILRTQSNYGRSPQSEDVSLPEELVRTPFPRSTDKILEQKDFVLAKIAQQAPQFFDPIKDTLERNPQDIKNIMPALVQGFPQLFSNDPYNRYDDKIMDPQKRELARKEIIDSDEISNTDKYHLMNRLNKTGEY